MKLTSVYSHEFFKLLLLGIEEKDLPMSPEELVALAEGLRVDDESQPKSCFFKAEETGECLHCGWHDGDGIKVCFYSKEYGALVHCNSMVAAQKTMTVDQQSLLDAYEGSHPHSCGGNVYLIAPYYIKCFGCECKIMLWKHGVNYDIG